MSGSLTAARLALPRPLTRDEQTLDEILDEWPLIEVTLYSGAGADDTDGAGLLTMPGVYTETCWQLSRSLETMRRNATLAGLASPSFIRSYVNLRSWYLTHEDLPELPKKRTWSRYTKGAREEMESQPGPRRKGTRRRGEPGWVLLGVAWIAKDFHFRPMLPNDLKRAA